MSSARLSARLWLYSALSLLVVAALAWSAAPASQGYAGGSPLAGQWVWVALVNDSQAKLVYADSWEDGSYDSSLSDCSPGVGFDQPSFTLDRAVRSACQFKGDFFGGGHGTGNLSVAGDANAFLYWDFNVHYAEANNWYCALNGDAPKILQLHMDVENDNLGDIALGKYPSLTCVVGPGEQVGAIVTGVVVAESSSRNSLLEAKVRVVPNVPTSDGVTKARVTLAVPGTGRVGARVTKIRDGSPTRVSVPLEKTLGSSLTDGDTLRATVKVRPLSTGKVRRDVDRVVLKADGVFRQSR